MMKTLLRQLQSRHQNCIYAAATALSGPSTEMKTSHQMLLCSRHLKIGTCQFHYKHNILSLTSQLHNHLFSTSCINLSNKQFVLNSSDYEFLESIGVDLKKIPSTVINTNTPTSVKSLVRFLEDRQLSSKQIATVIEKYPRIALVRPFELENRFNMLHDLGIEQEDVNKLFMRAPSVFSRLKTSSHFQDFIEFLQGMGLQNIHIIRIIHRSPMLLNRVKHIRTVVDYLRSIFHEHGLEEEFPKKIKHLLVQDPLLFVQSVPVIQEKVDFLSKIKISGKDIVRVIYNCPNALRTSNDHKLTIMNYIRDRLHLSQEELIDLIIFYPQLLYFSIEKLQVNIDFLYSEGFTARHIVGKPAVLTRSLSLLKQRCSELKEVKYDFTSLNIFLVNPQKYQERLEKLRVKRNQPEAGSETS